MPVKPKLQNIWLFKEVHGYNNEKISTVTLNESWTKWYSGANNTCKMGHIVILSYGRNTTKLQPNVRKLKWRM
jgi:hypothetical protein